MINFCYDRLSTPTIGYPNLAQWSAEPFTPGWRQFDLYWPQTIPLRLLMYLDAAHVPYSIYTVEDAPGGSWYPVAFSWFDFNCNYFSLLSTTVKEKLINREIKILFYYHEGDNPLSIEKHLHNMQISQLLPEGCYHLVSANSSANLLNNATYFSEHEFFFRHVNRKQRLLDYSHTRTHEFTALNRTHKWWRAAVMSDLQLQGVLSNSLWSYNSIAVDNEEDDNKGYKENPIEVDIPSRHWRRQMHKFVLDGPYYCDQLDKDQQNDHHYVNTDLYTRSYFQIILETHVDVDQSGGTFLTEKTWKPIKFGQPFVVIGPVGSLSILREKGYRVFDGVLDNSYDTIENNTERYLAVRNLLLSMREQGIAELFERCRDDIKHNQVNFEARVQSPLNTLIEKLQCQI
jgi:hypothetical protein